MKRQPYALAALLGLAAFFIQLLLVGVPRLSGLNGKSYSLVLQALSAVATSPVAVAWIAIYIFIGIAAHAIPLALIAKVVRDLQQRAPSSLRTAFRARGATLLAMLLVLTLILAWSRWLFPREQVAALAIATPAGIDLIFIAVLSSLVLGLAAIWTIAAASRRAIACAAALSCLLLFASSYSGPSRPAYSENTPNIIVLGIDSMRPDHLSSFGDPRSPAPVIDAFVSGSVNFERAYTPLARTFVAYMSLLSGQYPVNHQVRENLYPRDMFQRTELLPQILQRSGYTTIFALDESRFANIDDSFGFDYIVMPSPGVIDFVVGTLYDTAGTNLVQLIPGAWHLLPHVAGNRALPANYLPSMQNTKIANAIGAAPLDKPLFLVAHFCIAHVPFAPGPWHEGPLTDNYADSPAGYRKALSIADKQVAATLQSLRESGRLQNAIVVVLSDHGEGLGMNKDAWTLDDTSDTPVHFPRDLGHGTGALEDSQSHVVMAMQRYQDGKPLWPATRVQAPASLVDIAPTLLELASIESPVGSFDGVALIDSKANVIAPENRPIFIESGISGRSLETTEINNNAVANEFNYLYKVTNDLRFELIQEEIPNQLRRKQRAVVFRDYGVSSMPEAMAGGCWLVTNYKTRTRRCVVDPVTDPIAGSYSKLICAHFSKDTDFHADWCEGGPAQSDLSDRAPR